MLLFSTVLRIDPGKMRKQDFFDLINEWNNTNTKYAGNRIPDLNWQGETNFKCGSDDLWLAAEYYEKESTYAVRYQKYQDNGAVWDTDYVMNFRNMKMSVRLERSYTQDAMPTSKDFSSPYFIKHLIDKEYLKKDNDLPLLRTPIMVEDSVVDILGKIITGKTHYKYPVVYVSKNPKNDDKLDVSKLAWKLMGVAHVLVENDYSQNSIIRSACENMNEYNGSIGIYYPNQTFEHKKLVYNLSGGQDPKLFESVLSEISQYSNSMAIDPKMTWQGVNNALLLDRSITQSQTIQNIEEALRKNEEAKKALDESISEESKRRAEETVRTEREELNALLEMAAQEEEERNEKIKELTQKIQDLEAENAMIFHGALKTEGYPIIVAGKESEKFVGEIKDLLLFTLERAAKKLPENNRRRDVIEDIIESNDYQRISEKNIELIRTKLIGYRNMDSATRQFLESLGFKVEQGKGHYECSYYGDPRYTKTMSSTASAGNTGKAASREIIRMLYGLNDNQGDN